MTSHPLLLSIRNVSQVLNVSISTARELARRSDFPPCVHLGKVRRWFLYDIIQWVHAFRNAARATSAEEAKRSDALNLAAALAKSDELVELHEVAEMAGVSEEAVLVAVSTGGLPSPIELNRIDYWRPQDVAAWLAHSEAANNKGT